MKLEFSKAELENLAELEEAMAQQLANDAHVYTSAVCRGRARALRQLAEKVE